MLFVQLLLGLEIELQVLGSLMLARQVSYLDYQPDLALYLALCLVLYPDLCSVLDLAPYLALSLIHI